MRLAILSDVHGNSIALEAVLADAGRVDGHVVVGDHAAIGHDPVGVLLRLGGLPDAVCTRGNTDRYIVTGERPGPTIEEARRNVDLIANVTEVASSFAWTAGAVAAAGWLPALAELPVEHRLTLPDGTRVLMVHASPGEDDGIGIRPTASDDDLRALSRGAEADLIVVGHTHWPVDRTVDGVRIVNLGSVSNPWAPDLRASYAILDADERGHRLDHRRVAYDHAAVIAAIQQSGHAAGEFVIAFQRGERRPPWETAPQASPES